MDQAILSQFVEVFIALMLAVIAYLNKQRTDVAVKAANVAIESSISNAQMAAMEQRTQAAVVDHPATSENVQIGEFTVKVPYGDVGLDPSKYRYGTDDWQHAIANVLSAEASYSALSSATGKPTAANPLEVQAIRAAGLLSAFRGDTGKNAENIQANNAAVK